MISKFKAILNNLDEHTLEVVKKSSASMVVKVLGMVAGLFVSIMLGRTLGPEGVGIISLAEKIAMIVMTLALFGLPNVVVKEVAIAYEKKDWTYVNSVMKSALNINIIAIIIVHGITLLIIPYLVIDIFKEPELKTPLYIAVVASIFQVFSRIFASGVNGFRKIWQSNLVEQGISIWFVALSFGFIYLFDIFEINVILIAWLYAVGRGVVLISVFFYWKKISISKDAILDLKQRLLSSSKPIFTITLVTLISSNLSFFLLGVFSNSEEIGLFAVPLRLALLTSLILLITNSAISPKIAFLYSNNQIHELEQMIQKVTRSLLVIGIFAFLIFLLWGSMILSLWGADFVKSYIYLVILSIGQVFNIGTGSTGQLLIMAGFEKAHRNISLIFFSINVILMPVLIYFHGALGAAIGTTVIITFENLAKLFISKRKLKINIIF